METKALAHIIVVVNWILFGFFATFFIAYLLICFIDFDFVANFVVNVVKEEYEASEASEENYSIGELKKAARIAIFLIGFIGLVLLIVELCLNILLMKGVKQSKKTYCNIWLIINFIFFVLSCLALITSLFDFQTKDIVGFIFDLIYLIWTGFSLWVIKKLRDEFVRNETAHAGFAHFRA